MKTGDFHRGFTAHGGYHGKKLFVLCRLGFHKFPDDWPERELPWTFNFQKGESIKWEGRECEERYCYASEWKRKILR